MKKTHKITNIALTFMMIGVFLCQDVVYPAPMLRPSLQTSSLMEAPSRSLLAIRGAIKEISEDILDNPYEIAKFLQERFGLRRIKTSGKKILLISGDGFYIVKINHEEDYAYEKEKVFFRDGYNPLPKARLLYADDRSKIFIFDNIEYDSDAISLFRYLRTAQTTLQQLEGIMHNSARICARIHNTSMPSLDRAIYQDQGLDEQERRIGQRIDYLRSAGYGDSLPGLRKFTALKPKIEDREIILNHGDFSPWNIFVDPWTGELAGLIDGEASSIGVRSKELAKVIIGLIDARKNNHLLIKNLGGLLAAFLFAYFEEARINPEPILNSIPYYLASQLLWYAEGTERTFGNRAWVQWRIELCNWALSQDTFDIKKLTDFLEEEVGGLSLDRAEDLRVLSYSSFDEASGARIRARVGERVKFIFTAVLNHPIARAISATNISAELWTNANTGIWHEVDTPELTGCNNERVSFSGDLLIYEPSGKNAPYELTARVSLNDKVRHVNLPRGNAIIEADASFPTDEEKLAWHDAMGHTYAALMLDFDGTMKFYDRDVPLELFDVLIDILHERQAPFAINSSREEGTGSIVEFLNKLKTRAMELHKDFDARLMHVYLKNGKYGYNAGTGEPYYETLMSDEARRVANQILEAEEFARFIYPGIAWRDGHRATFTFRGGVDRDIFVRKLNERLEDHNIVALHTDDLFEICPKEGTKAAALTDFSNRTNTPIADIARLGDQGQLYGIDEPMINSPGGFSVFHKDPGSLFPLSAPAMIKERGPDAVIRILSELSFVEPTGLKTRVERSVTDTYL